jgi:hypothetical protein
MTHLEQVLLGYLSRHSRGPAAGRKVWKVVDDLRGLGLPATPRRVARALRALRTEGFGITITDGEFPTVHLADRRRPRGHNDWQPGRWLRGQTPATRAPADARLLAQAEAAYDALLAAALSRTDAAAAHHRRPVSDVGGGREPASGAGIGHVGPSVQADVAPGSRACLAVARLGGSRRPPKDRPHRRGTHAPALRAGGGRR